MIKLFSFFFFSNRKVFYEEPSGVPESEWTVILVHHLLSKLPVSEFYVIDSGCREKQYRCPCQCGEKLTGMYGDTSIGMFFFTTPPPPEFCSCSKSCGPYCLFFSNLV